MSKEFNYIDDYFKEGLENLDLMPPADVWDNIEKVLDRKRRIVLITLWSGLAAGLALFLTVGSIYFFNDKQNIPIVSQVGKSSKDTSQLTSHNPVNPSAKATSNKSSQKIILYGESSKKIVPFPEIKKDPLSKETLTKNDLALFVQKVAVKSSLQDNSDISKKNNSDSLTGMNSKDVVVRIIPKRVLFEGFPELKNLNPNIAYNNSGTNSLPFYNLFEPEAEAPKVHRWSIEGQIAPQYSYRNISVSGGSTSKSQFDSQEDGLIAYAGGLKVNYETGSRLSFQTGIVYSVIGQTLNDVYAVSESYTAKPVISLIAPAKVESYYANNSLGMITNSKSSNEALATSNAVVADGNKNSNFYTIANLNTVNKVDVKFIQQFSYIEIPFLARYILFDKKIGVHMVGGISTNVLVDNTVIAKTGSSSENIGETANLRRLNYNSNIGIGFNYKLWKKATLTLEPTFKYYLNSISDKSDINYHPYSFGIYTGVRYKF